MINDTLHNRFRFHRLMLHTKVLTITLSLLVAGTLVVLALEWDNPATLGNPDLNFGEKLLNAFSCPQRCAPRDLRRWIRPGLRTASKLVKGC